MYSVRVVLESRSIAVGVGAGVIGASSKAENPVDIFPDMMVHGFEKTCTQVLNALLEDDGVHAILFISFAAFGKEPYRPLVDLIQKRRNKPVFFSLLGEKEDVEVVRELLEAYRIPFYLFPERCIRVLSHMWGHAKRQRELP